MQVNCGSETIEYIPSGTNQAIKSEFSTGYAFRNRGRSRTSENIAQPERLLHSVDEIQQTVSLVALNVILQATTGSADEVQGERVIDPGNVEFSSASC